MTEVMGPPAPAPTNGNPANVPARIDRARPIVADGGEFQNLLDTGKFEHLWRVAQLFASSSMVPLAFQNKPADCLIACQMAIRLGVDPFMFMQNTYVYKGKPGMEGKLAIALINSSGLFRGPLHFDLGGTGDERGCTAWAVLKETGERINGPRVTIAIAKAEGWHGQNQKWKTIPDLMLQYRAGTWFGRLMCPERLMGMQTIDELRDEGVDSTQRLARPVDALNRALAKQSPPLDTGQTFDPSTAQVDTETGEVAEQGAGEQAAELHQSLPAATPAPSAAHDTPDQVDPAREEFDKWLIGAQELAEQKGIDAADFRRRMQLVYVGAKVKGREWTLTPAQRENVVKAIRERSGHFAETK